MSALKKKSKALRIALYIRVSTEEQAENPEGSIRNQEDRLRMAIQLKNMEANFGEIAAVFIDRARSGKDTNRPELQKLLLAIRKREIDLLMVSELSRISRSIKDFSQIWELMQKSDCAFTSLRENFDTTTAAGEMVLFTVANIAQFERRQISERVSANLNVRAQRGLFNGGSVPLGYKLIKDKPGYLEIDDESAALVRTAFKAFEQHGSVAPAVRWLNEQGFRLKVERGNGRKRLGYFTIGTLKAILKSRFYIGVKTFKQNGEMKETEAVWAPIVDRATFEKVNALLNENFRRNKSSMQERYPYRLVGLVSCEVCGSRMVGKSAHGRGGKIGYYEHSWATIKNGTKGAKKQHCECNRVLAKKLEPLVWFEITKLLSNPVVAKRLLENARKTHTLHPTSREAEKYNQTIFSADGQLESLAERLASLPKTISPTPIYRQMEKLEAHKREAQLKLLELKDTNLTREEPAQPAAFEQFLEGIRHALVNTESERLKNRIIHLLVRKVLVSSAGAEIYFNVGESFVTLVNQEGLRSVRASDAPQSTEGALIGAGENFEKKEGLVGSTTGQIGTRDRT